MSAVTLTVASLQRMKLRDFVTATNSSEEQLNGWSTHKSNWASARGVTVDELEVDAQELGWCWDSFVHTCVSYGKIRPCLDREVNRQRNASKMRAAWVFRKVREGIEASKSRSPQQCPKCSYIATTKSNLRAHLRSVHQEGEMYSCSTCGAEFATTSNLAVHSLQHTSDLPFECTDCDKGFKQKMLLTKHRRVHHPIVCSECGERFGRSEDLDRHNAVEHVRKRARLGL